MSGKFRFFSLLVLFGFLLNYSSCRKTDLVSQTVENRDAIVEAKFFNTHRSNNPTEKILVDYIKSQNDKTHFVAETVKKIGYPRWYKLLLSNSNNISASIVQNLAGDSSIAFIPFARDSENFVNASLIIKQIATDTTFKFINDWQYSQKQNSLTSINDEAENYATFFMVLDKVVFGNSFFYINDKSLFKKDGKIPLLIKIDSLTSMQNNLIEPNEICTQGTITYQDCPYPLGECVETNGACDNCPQCTSSLQWTNCTWNTGGGVGGGTTGSEGPPIYLQVVVVHQVVVAEDGQLQQHQ